MIRGFILGLLMATTIPYYQFRAPYNSPVNDLTVGVYQSGGDLYCPSTNGTEGYTCKLSGQSLTGYTPGMVVPFLADVPSMSNPSLNIDSMGIINIRDTTGTTTPTIPAGPHLLFFDGKVFRMMI